VPEVFNSTYDLRNLMDVSSRLRDDTGLDTPIFDLLRKHLFDKHDASEISGAAERVRAAGSLGVISAAGAASALIVVVPAIRRRFDGRCRSAHVQARSRVQITSARINPASTPYLSQMVEASYTQRNRM